MEIPKGEVRQVRAEVRVSSGRLRIDLRPGEWSEWLLNGLIITEMKPHIGHLPIYSALKGTDLTISVTVTSSFPFKGIWLFYKEETAVEYRKADMQGDRFVYSATIARTELNVEVIEYYIETEDEEGNLSYFPEGGKQRPISLKLAEDLKAPKVVEHKKVTAHSSSKPLTLSLKVDDDLNLADVWLHYRTVDQNADFKVISMEKEGDKKYSGTIPASDFDPIFDEMYYFELVDKFGNGSFYPDPFTGGRYYVIKITKEVYK